MPFWPFPELNFQNPSGSSRIETYLNGKLQWWYVGMHFWPFSELNFKDPIGSYRIEVYDKAKLEWRYVGLPFSHL